MFAVQLNGLHETFVQSRGWYVFSSRGMSWMSFIAVTRPSKLKCTETGLEVSINDIRLTHPSGTNAYRLTATLFERLVKPFTLTRPKH